MQGLQQKKTGVGVLHDGAASKIIISFARKIGFILISIFRWPIWLALWLLKRFRFFDYLFLVYPGTDSDLDGYCPRWLAKTWFFSKKPSIAGIIRKGPCGRGLYLVLPNTPRQFLNCKQVCETICARLEKICRLTGVKSVAIAGQVPGIIVRKGIELEKPFVKGLKGMVFSIMVALEEAINRREKSKGEVIISVIGAGFTGGYLISCLKNDGYNLVYGVDTKKQEKEEIYSPEVGKQIVNRSDAVIVLTSKGSDFLQYEKYLREGTIVLDDTHPKIKKIPANVDFFKVAVGISDSAFYPRLPGYKPEWIPGCVVEAMVSASTGEYGLSQNEFNAKAKELGFFPFMD
jgi:hypothetical protein